MPSGVLEPSSNFLADRSSVVLLLWILIVICISCLFPILYCLFLEALWLSAGRGWPLVCGVFFLVFLSLSHMVSWARCGIWLYGFPIFAFFLSFHRLIMEKTLKIFAETISPQLIQWLVLYINPCLALPWDQEFPYIL